LQTPQKKAQQSAAADFKQSFAFFRGFLAACVRLRGGTGISIRKRRNCKRKPQLLGANPILIEP